MRQLFSCMGSRSGRLLLRLVSCLLCPVHVPAVFWADGTRCHRHGLRFDRGVRPSRSGPWDAVLDFRPDAIGLVAFALAYTLFIDWLTPPSATAPFERYRGRQ